MTHIYNFSINTVLKSNSKTKLSSLPVLDNKLIDAIKTLLSTSLGENIKIIIGDEVASGTQFTLNDKNIQKIFSQEITHTKVSLSHLSEDPLLPPYGKYDNTHAYNYVSNIPVFVQSTSKLSQDKLFIKFDNELLSYFSQCFENCSAIAFGLGSNKELNNMFEVDFDCMFNIGRTLGIQYDNLISGFENPTGVMAKEMYILPFFTLPSFSAVYFQTEINILDKYYEWVRVFRATKAIFELLNINYKQIKGLSSWLTTPITKEDAINSESFIELDNIYEEDLLGFDDSHSDKKHLPAQLNTFSEASTGVLCSFLNWNDNGHKVTKVYYPIGHNDVEALKEVKSDLEKQFASLEDKQIELDDSNEGLLLSQINQPQLNQLD